MAIDSKEGDYCAGATRRPDHRAHQGIGLQITKKLVANGFAVLVGSRNSERGTVAQQNGPGAIALQLDVTHPVSIAIAAESIHKEFGCLNLLVNNAAISNTRKGILSLQEYKISI